jgi:hypothetical protein
LFLTTSAGASKRGGYDLLTGFRIDAGGLRQRRFIGQGSGSQAGRFRVQGIEALLPLAMMLTRRVGE